MTRRVGIIRFPGSTGFADAAEAVRLVGAEVHELDHTDTGFDVDVVLLPGGAAHGDALRPGALAALSPVIEPIRRHAEAGGTVIGIGNGFQILTEAGLLPGALLPNESGRFETAMVRVRVETTGEELQLPLAAGHARYHGDGTILLRHLDDPTGSEHDAAGIVSGSVVGVMVHPERAIHDLLGSTDGIAFLSSLIETGATTP